MTLAEALAWLPDDADGIAVVIYAAGIRGNHHCRTCPLAQLLSLLTGIAVGVDRCYAYTPRDLVMIAPLPSAARDFLMKFDRGWPRSDCAYPELEAA